MRTHMASHPHTHEHTHTHARTYMDMAFLAAWKSYTPPAAALRRTRIEREKERPTTSGCYPFPTTSTPPFSYPPTKLLSSPSSTLLTHPHSLPLHSNWLETAHVHGIAIHTNLGYLAFFCKLFFGTWKKVLHTYCLTTNVVLYKHYFPPTTVF